MNTRSRSSWRTLNVPVLTTLAAVCLGWAVWAGEGPRPDQVREEARRLEQKAQDLKAAGRGEEAERLMDEARALRGKFEAAGPRNEERPAVAQRRQELRVRLAEVREKLERQKAEGREAEATELREQMERLERELRSLGPGGKGPGAAVKEPPRAVRRPEPMQAARRMEHLQRAIENLRAGGMPELAERLAQGAARMRERMDRPELRGVPAAEIERLRAEIRELRQAMQQMKRRIEEVAERRP